MVRNTIRYGVLFLTVMLSAFFLACPPIEPLPTSCLEDGTSGAAHWGERELIFQSGFEPSTEIIEVNSASDDIVGNDLSMPELGDWEVDLEGHESIGSFKIFYADGNSSQRSSTLIPDPEDPDNQVLEFRLRHPNEPNTFGADKGRIQFGVNNNVELYALSYEVRFRLEDGIQQLEQYEAPITWFTLAEFWNNGANQPYPFRITINLNKESGEGEPFHWHMHAQERISKGNWNTLWEAESLTTPVQYNEWNMLRVDIQEGCEEHGWFRVRIIDKNNIMHTVFDAQNTTQHHNDPRPDGFVSFNPLKLYTSGTYVDWVREAGHNLVILWDDLKLYRGVDAR